MQKYRLFRRYHTNQKGKKYYYWWYYYYDPVTGRKRQYPAGDRETNKHHAEDFIAKLPAITPAGNSVISVAEPMFEENSLFLRRRQEFGFPIKPSTRKAYLGRVHNHILPDFGSRYIETITAQEIEDFLLEQEMKNSTRNALIDTWNFIFAEARRQGLMAEKPEIQRFRRDSERYDILTNEELEIIFPDNREQLIQRWKHADDGGDRDSLMFAVMLLTTVSAGLRSGEIRGMHRDQVYLDLSGLVINRQLDLEMQIDRPKKGSERNPRYRAIVMPERAVRGLRWWLEEYAPAEGPLFKYRGQLVDRATLLQRFRAGLEKAGLKTKGRKLGVHSLRYTYNTLLETVLSSKTLLQFMGHTSEQMTRHYSRPYWTQRLAEYQDQKVLVERLWR